MHATDAKRLAEQARAQGHRAIAFTTQTHGACKVSVRAGGDLHAPTVHYSGEHGRRALSDFLRAGR